MIVLCYLLFGSYAIIIAILIYGFYKVKTFRLPGLKPVNKFTIIVPFRNEANNLPVLLQSLSKLNYPTELWQLILVDDDSTETFDLENYGIPFTLIKNKRMSSSPKKDAILSAINLVTTDWIITTDADCKVHPDWLLTLDNYIQQHQPEMIVGAVTYESQNNFLHHFQQLDLASLQGATIGTFGIHKAFMCNGANFAYTKSVFRELKGFEGNDTIASGDDVFLLQKAIAQSPEKVHYLKAQNTIVYTKPLDSWKGLFFQRVRWASKTISYQSTFGKFVAIAVFAGNCSWLIALAYSFISNSFFGIPLLILKCAIDYILIQKTNIFLKRQTTHYLLATLVYPFFSTAVALYSMFGKYEWKGRKF